MRSNYNIIPAIIVLIIYFLITSLKANANDTPTLTISTDSAIAGSYQHIIFTFTVAKDTLIHGGGFRIEIPTGYGETAIFLWDRPQTEGKDLMGFITAIASDGSDISVRSYGVAGGIIQCDVTDPVLEPGKEIHLHYFGRVQSLARTITIRGQWRPTGESDWITIENQPKISIKPRKAVTMTMSSPADVMKGEKFNAALILLDTFGNRAIYYDRTVTFTATDEQEPVPAEYTFTEADSGILVLTDVSYSTSGFQKITATDGVLTSHTNYTFVHEREPEYRRYFGDTHFHTGTGTGDTGFSEGWGTNRGGDHRGNFTTQEEAYVYVRDVARLDFASASEHDNHSLDSLTWTESQRIADSFYDPGNFTTFYAYEWTSDDGHHVVLYKDKDGQVFHAHQHETISDLWNDLDNQKTPALTIPHVMWPFEDHTIWKQVNNTYRKVGEMYSLWNNRMLLPPHDDPHRFEIGIDNPWSYQYAWHRGHKIGLIGSSDNHLGQPGMNAYTVHTRHAGGLAAVVAEKNTRESIWQSFSYRRTYATTGTRIYLHFTADGNHMGSEYETDKPPVFHVRVGGTKNIDKVELIKYTGMEYVVLFADSPTGDISEFVYTDEEFLDDSMYYVRVRQVDSYPGMTYSDGTPEMAWSSPIWVHHKK